LGLLRGVLHFGSDGFVGDLDGLALAENGILKVALVWEGGVSWIFDIQIVEAL